VSSRETSPSEVCKCETDTRIALRRGDPTRSVSRNLRAEPARAFRQLRGLALEPRPAWWQQEQSDGA
jgi:hypothetical protein